MEYLEYLRDSGVTEVWENNSRVDDSPVRARAETTQPYSQGSAEETSAPVFESLEAVREYLGECTRCKLHRGRTHIVFGVGNPKAMLMFVGEGPGRDEDLQGEPFVGRAGQLLTDIIEKGSAALGVPLKRSDVYIANIVKCRPPENRNPEPDEIAACEPFLLGQIDVIKPKIICALGKFAAQTLLKTDTPISALRGRVFDYHGIKLVPTYHPAYLLRNMKEKPKVWEDFQKIMGLYKEQE